MCNASPWKWLRDRTRDLDNIPIAILLLQHPSNSPSSLLSQAAPKLNHHWFNKFRHWAYTGYQCFSQLPQEERKVSLGLKPSANSRERNHPEEQLYKNKANPAKLSNMERERNDSLIKGNKHRSSTKRPDLKVFTKPEEEGSPLNRNECPSFNYKFCPTGKQRDSWLNLYRSTPGWRRRGSIQVKMAPHYHLQKTSLVLTPHSNPLLYFQVWKLMDGIEDS